MTWFKIDDGFHKHRKRRRAGVEAVGLWTICGSWTSDALEDGFVPESEARAIGGSRWRALADRLVAAELWYPAVKGGEPGFQMHDFTDYNPTRAEVEADRDSARERMRKRRGTSPDVPPNNDGTSGEVQEPRPDPSLSTSPQPPTALGEPCQKHKPELGADCRACGTNRRAVDKASRRAGPWCGQCDQTTRMYGDEQPRKCPCAAPLQAVGS